MCSFCSVQFSHSVMSNTLWLHGLQHSRPPCPSPTPGVYPNSCPLSRWCHPTISSSVVPFSSCPQLHVHRENLLKFSLLIEYQSWQHALRLSSQLIFSFNNGIYWVLFTEDTEMKDGPCLQGAHSLKEEMRRQLHKYNKMLNKNGIQVKHKGRLIHFS